MKQDNSLIGKLRCISVTLGHNYPHSACVPRAGAGKTLKHGTLRPLIRSCLTSCQVLVPGLQKTKYTRCRDRRRNGLVQMHVLQPEK